MEKTQFNNKSPSPPILPINEHDLYEIRTLSDNKAGELIWYMPMTALGTQDPTRAYIFKGKTLINTPMGPRPLEFELESVTFSEALIEWPRKLEAAIRDMQDKLLEATLRAKPSLGPKLS
jgi:hypothetical protein